ncbi:glycosyltransferase family 4 protein [Aidingimonas lacisalsi]|uniref:glycosyltransferase family 4 protein n=1 Tax=Aidingimonas lacisalsi TaxID=2604086 RepID=UPI0011D22ADB|nr:glycosyltransferase family 4 protein [Aidingimonas lacisalsi]
MVKVLVIASFTDSLLQFRGALLTEIDKRGHEVHVAAPGLRDKDAVGEALKQRGMFIHDLSLQRTGMDPIRDLATLLAMLRIVQQIRPDLVLAYTIKPVVYGVFVSWLARVPRRYALITGLGYAFTGEVKGKRGIVAWLVQRLYAFSLRRTHKVFFQNHDDRALFFSRGILAPHVPSLVVNGSGIDTRQYVPAPFAVTPIVFLLIARLLGDKGIREFAEAARWIKARYPSAVFQLVGWIDDNPDAIQPSELDLWIRDGVVQFLGRLTDVRSVIASSHIYVLPSYREGTPRTVLEAMAMGRPVITSDAPGCRETVVDGENGFLTPVQDSLSLALAMERFILEPELVIRMGRRSREIAVAKYDVHKVNAALMTEMGLS